MSLLDDEASVKAACVMLAQQTVLALDCEGENLGRAGKLSLVQLATKDGHGFVIDIAGTGGKAMEWGLKALLERRDLVKLFWDCRQDVAALEVLHDVRLTNIRDLQLLELYTRDEDNDDRIRRLCGVLHRGDVFGQRHLYRHLHRLASLAKCLEELGIGDHEHKKDITDAVRANSRFWMQRPLPASAIECASQGAGTLFLVLDALQAHRLSLGGSFDVQTCERLAIASERYSRLKVSPAGADAYYEHPFLPLCVIEGFPQSTVEGSGRFVICACCGRNFPRELFSKTLLRRPTKLRCDVCRAVDINASSRLQWSLKDEDDGVGYDSDATDLNYGSD